MMGARHSAGLRSVKHHDQKFFHHRVHRGHREKPL